jgi:UDP-2,3-diacylglucosamine pyrophosphatase LpxH
MKILLLHLSDIHFKARTDTVLSQVQSIAATTFSRIHSAEAVFVVISGDVAYSGNREQYEIASAFLEELRAALADETDSPIHFILAPGNHDCDFSGDQSVRQALIGTVLQKDGANLSPAIVAECVKVQECFFEFRNTWGPSEKSLDDPLWAAYSFDIGGYRVVFDCLNVSWMSQLHEEQGKLIFPVEPYEYLKSEPAQIRIAILHHPLNWYSQATYRPFRKLVRTLAQIVITGHEHEQNVGENLDAESEQSTYVEGGVLQAHDHKTPPSFNVIELDLDGQQYVCELHSWNGTLFTPREVAAWQDYRQLPKKRRNELVLSDEFSKQLDDPGGAFSHPGKQKITLSDVYVFPDLLRCGGHDPKIKETVNSGSLRDLDLLTKGILLKGDEKSGKTSLVYQLFRYFHDSGCAPLLLQGSDLKPNERELKKAIEQAVSRQYGHEALIQFKQIPSAQKIAFVDDFDAPKLTNPQRAEMLRILQAEFGGLLLTVSDLFEMDEVVNEGTIRALVGFKEYALPLLSKTDYDVESSEGVVYW